ncbi:response regulator, partial [bacterium]|nr:response regulator [bacterium]
MSSFSPLLFTILVVDDDAIGRLLLTKILEREGYIIDTADGGVEALKKITKNKYDMLLLDIVMPDLDGIQLLLKMQDMGISASTPVIMLTGKSNHESKKEAFGSGAVDYITKPYQDYDVYARVKVHLKNLYNARLLVEQQTAHMMHVEKIKQSILVNPSSLPHARFSVLHESVQEIGGDFYDVISLGNQITFYSVADASGHDIGTSYLTPAYKALLRQNVSILNTVSETMQMVNKVLCGVFDDERYITAVSLII